MRCAQRVLFLAPLLLGGCAGMKSTSSPGPTQPYGGIVQVIPGKVEAEHYDEGEAEVAYHDVDDENHGADYRGVTHVDIEQRSDASGGYGIGWTRAGEWLVYTVDVRESGTYTLTIPVASKLKGGTFHLEFDGVDKTGPIQVPDTGGWQTLKTIRVEGVDLNAGVQVMKAVMREEGPSGSIADIDFIRFERNP